MRPWPRAALALVLLSVACTAPRPQPATGTPAGPGPAPMAYPLFDVALDIGAVRLGEPLRVAAVARSRAATDSASLFLIMPEVATAERSGWGEDYVQWPMGVRFPAEDSVHGRVTPDSPLVLRTDVQLRAPGYYYGIVTASAADAGRFAEDGVPLVTPTHTSFYVWLDEEGGYVTDDFDPTRLPVWAEASPGPIRALTRGGPVQELLASGRANPVTHAAVRGRVNARDGRAVANARVQVRAWVDGCPGRPLAEEIVRTDERGEFSVRLTSYFPRATPACVAVHADRGAQHATRHAEAEFRLVAEAPAALELTLQLEDAGARR